MSVLSSCLKLFIVLGMHNFVFRATNVIIHLRGIKLICYTWKFVGSYFTSMNLTEWWLDDKTNFTLTFLLFFSATRPRANVLYRTRANIDGYRTRANVFISDQGQRFWFFWNIPIYRTRANTQNEDIGLGPTPGRN